ncbi:hypothetical protein COCOBI_pt-0730 (chloroplast) [Coccomyxa sp. Obi]|nr:hypothetical protein COCOBI_pt-0730 [Coccomyxa sp. Obi]
MPLIRHNFSRLVEMFAAIHFRVAFAERRDSLGWEFHGHPCIPCTPLGVHGMQEGATKGLSSKGYKSSRVKTLSTSQSQLLEIKLCQLNCLS